MCELRKTIQMAKYSHGTCELSKAIFFKVEKHSSIRWSCSFHDCVYTHSKASWYRTLRTHRKVKGGSLFNKSPFIRVPLGRGERPCMLTYTFNSSDGHFLPCLESRAWKKRREEGRKRKCPKIHLLFYIYLLNFFAEENEFSFLKRSNLSGQLSHECEGTWLCDFGDAMMPLLPTCWA